MPPPGGSSPGDRDKARRRIPSFGQALARELKAALKAHGNWWFGQMALRFRAPLTRYGQANPYDTLHNRTNSLRNSLRHKVQGTKLADLGLRMWTDHPGARLQEYGGVVRARKGRFMAIPADDNLTPAGAPRYRSPRDPAIADGRFVLLPSGGLWFVKDVGGDVKFLFALRQEVDIPGPGPQARRRRPSRFGMRETAIGAESRSRLRRNFVMATKRAVEVSAGGTGGGGGGG